MSFIQWNPGLETGIEKIDKQHMEFVDMLNLFNESILSGKHESAVSHILKHLIDYTHFHFNEEVKLIDESDYTHAEVHKRDHAGFMKAISDFTDLSYEHDREPYYDILDYMQSWIITHVRYVDMDFFRYLDDADLVEELESA